MSNKLLLNFLKKPAGNLYNDPRRYEKGRIKALQLLKRASIGIPAYKDFLKKNKFKFNKKSTILDFEKVPPTTKESYVLKYDLKDRCWDAKVNSIHTIASSSGSTGEPVFWPREVEQEIDGAIIHEYLLNKVFEISKKKTLIINSFGLGNWIAGMYTEFSLYLLRLKGSQFTLASPGYNQEEIFKIVRNFSRYFDQTIITCHPPVLKMMIENGLAEGIEWKKLNVKFLGAGEGFSENWRDYLLSLVGQKDPYRSFINIYGSADAGLMGFESPLSILLHRITSTNRKLNVSLFKSDRNPYLYQFDPMIKYLEVNDQKEITITCDATAPLLKYNIHDQGGILEFSKIKNLAKINQNEKKDWLLPFVYVFGRDKFMISLYGVNIYPENIKATLEDMSLQLYLTGRFVAEKKHDKQQNQYLLLSVELRSGVKVSKTIEVAVKNMFINTIKKLNSEYKYVEERYKVKMHPKISLVRFQDPKYFPEGKIIKMA